MTEIYTIYSTTSYAFNMPTLMSIRRYRRRVIWRFLFILAFLAIEKLNWLKKRSKRPVSRLRIYPLRSIAPYSQAPFDMDLINDIQFINNFR